MRNNLVLGVAAALSLAPALLPLAARADVISDQWLKAATATTQHRLEAAGVQPGSRAVDLEVRVDGSGAITSRRVLVSSGSRDLDDRITAAVRRVHVESPPALLSGRAVVMRVNVSDAQVAALNAGRGGGE